MIKPAYLAYVPDLFGVQASIYCLYDENGAYRFLSARELSEFANPFVTYDLSSLIDDLRRRQVPPPTMPIDVSEALKLCAGIPRDEGGEKLADLWTHFLGHFDNTAPAIQFKSIFQGREPRPSQADAEELTQLAAKALQNLWRMTRKRLNDAGELVRFESVEAPLHGVFGNRQWSGIAVDRTVAAELMLKVTDEKYRAYSAVAASLNCSPTGLNFWNVQAHLNRTDVAHLADISDGGRLREAFKMAQFTSQFAREFLSYADAGRDEGIIRQATGADDRVHPVFQVFGTVTGRVMVSDPYLQQLRRSYRKLIVADPGQRLIYLDYSQFEPGILASLCGDKNLISAYNEGDLYIALSNRIFGRADQRPLSKRMFLAFCYGMTADRIAGLVTSNSEQQNAYRDAVEQFFGVFPGLSEFRVKSQLELASTGNVQSPVGNSRHRTRTGALTSKEQRWALNHPVQSTASLIFKEALVNLAAKFGRDSIILPVHDAVLMQFDANEKFESQVNCAEQIMTAAFRRRCPDIEPRMSVGSFFV